MDGVTYIFDIIILPSDSPAWGLFKFANKVLER